MAALDPGHRMSLDRTSTPCGDGYCAGHNKTFVVCSCGWRQEVKRYAGIEYDPVAAEIDHIKHRLDVLEARCS